MKKLVLNAYLLLFPLFIVAQNSWSITLPSVNFGRHCTTTQDGGFVTYSTNPNRIIKVSPSGGVMWTRGIDSTEFWLIHDVVETSDRGVAVLALTMDQDWTIVMKFDEFGQLLWQKEATTAFTGLQANWICPTHTGGGVILGGGECHLSYYAIKLDAAGNEVWLQEHGNITQAVTGFFYGMVPTSTTGYFSIYNYLDSPDLDWGIMRLDENGQALWAKTIDEGPAADQVQDMILTHDGGLAVLGTTDNHLPSGHKTTLAIFDSTANLISYMVYDDASTYTPYSLVQTNDGGYMFTGISSHTLMLLVKTDAMGNIQWQQEGTMSNTMMGGGLSMSPDGLVYCTGWDQNTGYFAAKISPWTGAGLCSTTPTQLNATSHTMTIITEAPTTFAGLVTYRPGLFVVDNIQYEPTMLCSAVGNTEPKPSLQATCGPNPFVDLVHIDLGKAYESDGMVHLMDLQGRILQSKAIDAYAQMLDWKLPNLPSGMYYLQILGEYGQQTIPVFKGN